MIGTKNLFVLLVLPVRGALGVGKYIVLIVSE